MSAAPPTAQPKRSVLRDLGIRTKILASIIVAVLAAGMIGALGITALSSSNDNAQAMYATNFAGLDEAANLRRLFIQLRLDVANHAISTDPADIATNESQSSETEARIREIIASYGARLPAGEKKEALRRFAQDLEAYVAVRDAKLLPAGRANDMKTWAAVRDSEVAPIGASMSETVDALVKTERAEAEQAAEDTEAAFTGNRTTILVALAIGMLAALGLGWATARGIMA
ncbi:MCP four helix bundle domain-containing protein, partial [Planobispora takensis]